MYVYIYMRARLVEVFEFHGRSDLVPPVIKPDLEMRRRSRRRLRRLARLGLLGRRLQVAHGVAASKAWFRSLQSEGVAASKAKGLQAPPRSPQGRSDRDTVPMHLPGRCRCPPGRSS